MHKSLAKFVAFAFLISNEAGVAVPTVELCLTSPNAQATATFVQSWFEAGFTRYRYEVRGTDPCAFQNCGGIAFNFHSWLQDDYGVFDDSEGTGIAGQTVINCGICAITGQSCT